MADMLGISKSFYSQLENRHRRLLYDKAVKMAAIFDMKPDELFYDDHIKYKEDNNLENQNPINMKDLDKVMNELNLCEITSEALGLIRRYLDRLILIIERSRIREYMMLTDSKRRLFLINFVAGLGKGFGQAIGFTVLAALVLYLLSTWVDLPVIGAFIAKLINIVDQYREGR